MKKLNLTFKAYENNGKVDRYEKSSIRAFYNHARSIDFSKLKKIYLRVSYGRHLDNFGKMKTFYNDGFYETKKDFFEALSAFTETSLVNDFQED